MRFRSLGLTLEQLKKEADSGNHGAQAELCLEYLIGEKTAISISKAIEYMQLAAEDLYAINMCFKSAREMDETAAYFAIAMQWEYGLGVPYSMEQCAENLIIAAERGYPYAQQSLGTKYRFGFGVATDYHKCEHWHLKALQSGLTEAHFDLHLLYSQEDQLMDADKAWTHLQHAVTSDNAHPNSYLFMGNAYLNGTYSSPDKIKATQWFLIAQNNNGYKAKQLDHLKSALSEAEWSVAESMAREWITAHTTR